MSVTLRGLTWDHPRAYQGLLLETKRFNASQSAIHLVWERHSLRAFEAAPIAELAARYDLITFDHPFIGDAFAARCLLDLTPHATALGLDDIAKDSVGESYGTYTFGGGQWALPIDAACQTAAYRADLISRLGERVPETVGEALRFGQHHQLGLALAVPHAFMNVLTICSLLGADVSGEGDELIQRDTAIEGIELHRQLASYVPRAALDWSSIGLLNAMATSDEIAYSPMVFCFNTYARPDRAPLLKEIDYGEPPGFAAAMGGGPVIGGAGLAISATCGNIDAAVTTLGNLMAQDAQLRIAISGGQPGRVSVWNDFSADAANGGFFSECHTSMAHAAVRPRYAGYINLQNAAGALLRDDIDERHHTASQLVDEINRIQRRSRSRTLTAEGTNQRYGNET